MIFSIVPRYVKLGTLGAAGSSPSPVVAAHYAHACTGVRAAVGVPYDWTDARPIEGIASIRNACKPQHDANVTRALNPVEAPSCEVPGDE